MKVNLRKISFRVLIVVAVLIVAVLVVRAVLNYTTGKRLEAFLQKAKSEGVPFHVRDLIKDCPEDENAAKLWKAAEDLLSLDEKDRANLNRPLENSFYRRPLDGDMRSRLQVLIKKNRRALDLAIEASIRPCLHLGLWETRSGGTGDEQVTTIVKTLQVTKLLAIDALLRADRGEVMLALEDCRSGLMLARRLLDEPSLIGALAAVADARQMVGTFGRIVEGQDIGQETLASWIGDLDPRSWRSLFAKVLPAERANSLDMGLKIIEGDAAAIKSSSGTGISASRFWNWLLRPAIKLELVWFQGVFENAGNTYMLPYFEQRRPLTQLSQRLASPPWYVKMTGGLRSDFQAPALKEAMLEATMLATRAGLASRIYKKKTGHFPTNLDSLVPDILPEIPLDPFTGKPLVFRIGDGELLIYSLGSNQKDDGGRGSFLIDRAVMDKDDDWAWIDKMR